MNSFSKIARWIFLCLNVFHFLAGPAHAAEGFTNEARPTNIEVIQNQGFVIFGAFGNPGSSPCGAGDKILVVVAHPQYQVLLSIALTAMTSGAKLKAYVHGCTLVGWYGTTVNQLSPGGTLLVSP